MAYTYDDFEKAAIAAGLLGNFSQYDLDLARAYPEAGLSLLSLKQDWNNATTDEARLLANEAANQIRSSYGAYTGGTDGSKYYAVTPQTATRTGWLSANCASPSAASMARRASSMALAVLSTESNCSAAFARAARSCSGVRNFFTPFGS